MTEVSDTGVALTDGSAVDCGTVVWCAGVAPHPLIDTLGLPTTRGRLVVDPFLRTAEHPEVYAIGDAAAVPDLTSPVDSNGHHALCPPTAQHAMRQATAAARNILSDIGGDRGRPYRHRDLGLVVDLGGPDAVAVPLGRQLRGRAAKAVSVRLSPLRAAHHEAPHPGGRRLGARRAPLRTTSLSAWLPPLPPTWRVPKPIRADQARARDSTTPARRGRERASPSASKTSQPAERELVTTCARS